MPALPDRGPIRSMVVLIPTFNERENLPLIVGRLRAAQPSAHVLVLDDNSPDGTGELADVLAAADDHIHVMHRAGKEGLGAAYLAGFAWALDQGYDAVIEMDADGSHQPEQLERLIDALGDADLVIGSRWIRGGSVVNWPLRRKALSVGGNLYTKVLLRMPVNDATAGFRVYRSTALRQIDLGGVESYGYCFQVDLTRRIIAAGLSAREVPIDFIERELGQSKMNPDIARESLRNITRWGLAERGEDVRRAASAVRARWARPEKWHRP